MRGFVLLSVLSAIGFAPSTLAQTAPVGVGNQTIIPGSVPIGDRNQWCVAQKNSCADLCPGMNWANNTCIPTTLEYSCVCQDGSTPNLALYMDTIPYHICETYVAQCVQNQTGPGGSA